MSLNAIPTDQFQIREIWKYHTRIEELKRKVSEGVFEQDKKYAAEQILDAIPKKKRAIFDFLHSPLQVDHIPSYYKNRR